MSKEFAPAPEVFLVGVESKELAVVWVETGTRGLFWVNLPATDAVVEVAATTDTVLVAYSETLCVLSFFKLSTNAAELLPVVMSFPAFVVTVTVML